MVQRPGIKAFYNFRPTIRAPVVESHVVRERRGGRFVLCSSICRRLTKYRECLCSRN